jgi:hypothetical protein
MAEEAPDPNLFGRTDEVQGHIDRLRQELRELGAQLDPGDAIERAREAIVAVRRINRILGDLFGEAPVPSVDMAALDEALAEALGIPPPHAWIEIRSLWPGARLRFEARVQVSRDRVVHGASESPLVALANALKMHGLYEPPEE